MSKQSKRNRLVSWVGVLVVAVFAFFYMDQSVQARDLQRDADSSLAAAKADSPWYASAFSSKLILGAQADFRDPLY